MAYLNNLTPVLPKQTKIEKISAKSQPAIASRYYKYWNAKTLTSENFSASDEIKYHRVGNRQVACDLWSSQRPADVYIE